MRLVRSLRRASLIGAVLAVAITGSAFAHECYNASTSVQGNLMKGTHSNGNWIVEVDVRRLIATGSSGPISGLPALNACQQDAFLAYWSTTGLPLVFTGGGNNNMATGQGGVIAENNPNMDTKLGGNNRGIDHFGVTQETIMGDLEAGYGAAFSAACS